MGNFNNKLALVLVLLIFGTWALQGSGRIELPGEVMGGILVAFSLIVQFYFRRAPPNGGAP